MRAGPQVDESKMPTSKEVVNMSEGAAAVSAAGTRSYNHGGSEVDWASMPLPVVAPHRDAAQGQPGSGPTLSTMSSTSTAAMLSPSDSQAPSGGSGKPLSPQDVNNSQVDSPCWDYL